MVARTENTAVRNFYLPYIYIYMPGHGEREKGGDPASNIVARFSHRFQFDLCIPRAGEKREPAVQCGSHEKETTETSSSILGCAQPPLPYATAIKGDEVR